MTFPTYYERLKEIRKMLKSGEMVDVQTIYNALEEIIQILLEQEIERQ